MTLIGLLLTISLITVNTGLLVGTVYTIVTERKMITFFNRVGIIHKDFVPTGMTENAAFYVQMLIFSKLRIARGTIHCRVLETSLSQCAVPRYDCAEAAEEI